MLCTFVQPGQVYYVPMRQSSSVLPVRVPGGGRGLKVLDATSTIAMSEPGSVRVIEALRRQYDSRASAVVDSGRRDLFEMTRWPRRREYQEPLLEQLELASRALDGTSHTQPQERERHGEAIRTVLGAELRALSAPTRAAMRERDAAHAAREATAGGEEAQMHTTASDEKAQQLARATATADAAYKKAWRLSSKGIEEIGEMGSAPIMLGHLGDLGSNARDGVTLPSGRTVVVADRQSELGNPIVMEEQTADERDAVCVGYEELIRAADGDAAAARLLEEAAAGRRKVQRELLAPEGCAAREDAIEALVERLVCGERLWLGCRCWPHQCHTGSLAVMLLERAGLTAEAKQLGTQLYNQWACGGTRARGRRQQQLRDGWAESGMQREASEDNETEAAAAVEPSFERPGAPLASAMTVAEGTLRGREKQAARMRAGPRAEWPALPEAAGEDEMTRSSDGTLLPVAWRVGRRLREAALVASGVIAERRRRMRRASEAAAQRLGTTRREQRASARSARTAARSEAAAQERSAQQEAMWAMGAAARNSQLRERRDNKAMSGGCEVGALLTAAEEGDQEARGQLSAVWDVRMPLAYFRDDVEDWSSRRGHVRANIVGYTEDGEVQVQPVGTVVGCKVQRVVGGRRQRAEYTQWEMCTLTWREVRGEKRYGRHRVSPAR